jgi:DNA replication protein DnaC
MIRSGENQFVPGSNIPSVSSNVDVYDNDLLNEYLLSAGWQRGVGLLFIGAAGCGKTTTGISVLKEIHRVHTVEMFYWTEYDYLSDLRNLWRMEEMTQKYSRDDALWKEYTEWERVFWNMKESPFLFLDDVGRGYTPMHTYEVENLLRLRESKSLPTVVSCQTGLWDNLPSGFKSVVERNSMVVRLDVRNG